MPDTVRYLYEARLYLYDRHDVSEFGSTPIFRCLVAIILTDTLLVSTRTYLLPEHTATHFDIYLHSPLLNTEHMTQVFK
jgi:hypothetical protein